MSNIIGKFQFPAYVDWKDLDEVITELNRHGDWIKDRLLHWIGKNYALKYFDIISDEEYGDSHGKP